jgi:hypothetical protein
MLTFTCFCYVGGFSLALGLKDVSLVSQAARETDTPMPFLSVLLDRCVGDVVYWTMINLAQNFGFEVLHR